MSKVLIVDDKELMRDSVATTLARKGHVVATASGGEAAVRKIVQRQFDCVITDLQMPAMDGLELLEEIHRLDEQLPVIFMTAYGTVETAVAAMKKGAYDYITKPFSGDELLLPNLYNVAQGYGTMFFSVVPVWLTHFVVVKLTRPAPVASEGPPSLTASAPVRAP